MMMQLTIRILKRNYIAFFQMKVGDLAQLYILKKRQYFDMSVRFRIPRKDSKDSSILSSSSIKRFNSSPDFNMQSSSSLTSQHYPRSQVNKILSSSHQSAVYMMVPYYMRLKIKDINQISYRESTAVMNASLVINIDITGLTPEILKKIKSRLVLQINHCEQVKIKEKTDIEITESTEIIREGKQVIKLKQLKITMRKEFKVAVQKQYSKIIFSPFEQLVVIATFTLNNIVWESGKRKFRISFNSMKLCMNDIISDRIKHMTKLKAFLREIEYEEKNIKDVNTELKSIDKVVEKRTELFSELFLKDYHSLSLKLYLKEMRLQFDKANCGDYQFSTQRFGVEDTNKKQHTKHNQTCLGSPENQGSGSSQKSQKDNNASQQFRKDGYENVKFNKKQKPFKDVHQYTHFCVTLYKSPFPQIFTILLPNLFLGIISFYVFFLKQNLIERTNIIATLVLGFIQLIPSIKAQLSDSTKVTLIELLTCFSTLLCLVSFYDSFTREESIVDDGKSSQRYSLDALWGQNPFFMFSMIVNILLLGIVVLSIGYFYFHQRKYLLEPSFYKCKPPVSSLKTFCLSWLYKLPFLKKPTQQESSAKLASLRKYSDYVLLKDFFKIPNHYEHRFSKFWSNEALQEKLREHKGRYEQFENSELRTELLTG